MNAVSGSTTTLAAITDACKGDQALMTETLARFTTFAGIGIFCGQGVGSLIYSRTRSDRLVYLIRAIVEKFHVDCSAVPPQKRFAKTACADPGLQSLPCLLQTAAGLPSLRVQLLPCMTLDYCREGAA